MRSCSPEAGTHERPVLAEGAPSGVRKELSPGGQKSGLHRLGRIY
jgi:hypothetical protein